MYDILCHLSRNMNMDIALSVIYQENLHGDGPVCHYSRIFYIDTVLSTFMKHMEISLAGLSFSSVRHYRVSDCRMMDER
jgi:hypothetical protein